MTEQEIVDKVKAIMNEIGEEENLSLLSEDTVKIEEYIKSAIPDAVALVQLNSPVRCVNKKMGAVNSGNADSSGKCVVALPADYVTLIAIKLSEWKRACVTAYAMSSEEYKRQCNPYTKAGSNKPVCVLGYSNTGAKELWLYSVKESGNFNVELFVYESKYDSTQGLDLENNDPIAISVCYMTASLVYSYFENKPTADEMKAVALSYIPQN